MLLDTIAEQFVEAKPYYRTISTSWHALFPGKYARAMKYARNTYKIAKYAQAKRKGATTAELVGMEIFGRLRGKMMAPFTTRMCHLHVRAARTHHDPFRKNGVGGRSWIDRPGRYNMVIVYHDANRAGPHVDVHIGRLSLIYKVKPDVYAQLKYNRDGYLTDNSKKILMDFVRGEIADGSRLAQNIDHTVTNAHASWTNGDREGTNYGDGFTRQIISESQVDIYKAYWDGPIEFYAPALNARQSMYLYKIYDGKVPIVIWGNKATKHPAFTDRLHLKLEVHPDEQKMDMSTSTLKYDGSSAYIVVGPKGTRVFSPRYSKVTGERIEYTPKLNGLSHAHSDETIIAMGEVMFKQKSWNPFAETKYLPQSQASGILNSNELVPKGYEVEVRVYRVDKVGRTNVRDLPFHENRDLQHQVAAKSEFMKVVDYMTPEEAHERGFEGVVVAPYGGSVNDGYKIKYVDDALDWKIVSVDFGDGDKGGIAGVVRAESLESGKSFNLGPGQMGDHTLCRDMMQHPERYEGRVIKVESRRGHEGRAAKVVGFHDDKGIAWV